MSLFGSFDLGDFAIALRSAAAAFGKVAPPHGFDALAMYDLGIDQGGTTFTSRNGRGKAIVVQKDGELVVAFRGTDHLNDALDYDNISVTKSYFKQFERLLDKVADYARDGDLHVTFTGVSLGGAVTNIIADHADTFLGGAFADAAFIGIASPYLSHNRKADIFNFGYNNDPVYHVVPGSWGDKARAMSTNHLFLYQNHDHWKTDNLHDRLNVHKIGNYSDAAVALSEIVLDDGTLLADKLNMHSFVLFDSTREVLRAGRLNHPGNSPVTVIGEGRRDRMTGASEGDHGSHQEWFFGRGGDDDIHGRAGKDLLYGGNGNDRLFGGSGVDYASGGKGNDRISLEDHRDSASGGAGNDTFLVANILPVNAGGEPVAAGHYAARLFIQDFVAGEDTLNLRAIDGDLDHKGDQKLHFAGYIRYDASDGLSDLEKGYVNDTSPGSVTIFEDKAGDTRVIVNTDSDRGREIEIVLHGDVGNIVNDLLL
jgi:hypothetical protein